MTKLPGVPKETVYLAGMIAAGAAVLFIMAKGFKGTAKAVTGAAVNAVGGAVEGTVKAIGENVGVPDTNKTQCQKDLAAGNTWASSFSCDAGTFIKSLFGIGTSKPATETKTPEIKANTATLGSTAPATPPDDEEDPDPAGRTGSDV